MSMMETFAQIWLRYFPRNQFFFLPFDQLVAPESAQIQLGRMSRFLNIDPGDFGNFDNVNPSKEKHKQKLWLETKVQIEAFFWPSYLRLCDLIPNACSVLETVRAAHEAIKRGEANCEKERDGIAVWSKGCETGEVV